MSVDEEQYAHCPEESMLRTTLKTLSTGVPGDILDWRSGCQEELVDLLLPGAIYRSLLRYIYHVGVSDWLI